MDMTKKEEFSSLVSSISTKLDRLIQEYTINKVQEALIKKQRIPRKLKKKQNKNIHKQS